MQLIYHNSLSHRFYLIHKEEHHQRLGVEAISNCVVIFCEISLAWIKMITIEPQTIRLLQRLLQESVSIGSCKREEGKRARI